MTLEEITQNWHLLTNEQLERLYVATLEVWLEWPSGRATPTEKMEQVEAMRFLLKSIRRLEAEVQDGVLTPLQQRLRELAVQAEARLLN